MYNNFYIFEFGLNNPNSQTKTAHILKWALLGMLCHLVISQVSIYLFLSIVNKSPMFNLKSQQFIYYFVLIYLSVYSRPLNS